MQVEDQQKSVAKTWDFKTIGAAVLIAILFILIVIAMTTEWFSWINFKKLFE